MSQWTGVVNAAAWPLVTLIFSVVFIIVFRGDIRSLLARIAHAKLGNSELQLFEPIKREDSFPTQPQDVAQDTATGGETAEAAVPDSVFSEDDLVAALTSIPELADTGPAIRNDAKSLTMRPFQHGIITKGQLAKFVGSEDILDTIRGLYQSELGRGLDRGGDYGGVVDWGAPLFVYGLRTDLIEGIRHKIRQSPEYAEGNHERQRARRVKRIGS